jgi:hypothetical protein
MIDLCKYKNIFGKPNEGVHQYRLFNIAIIDLLITIISAFLISYFFNYSTIKTFIVLFLLGIIFHKVFCVNTTINKMIFGKIKNEK